MLQGFEQFDIQTTDPEVVIRGKRGGSGPPLLLLHGNPLSHRSWYNIAPRLAERFTVVMCDLRGYGESSKPRGLPDHSNYSFRRMAQDQVDVMSHFGFDRFFVAGHDRGARVAHRMSLDHPAKVLRAAFLDIVPTPVIWSEMNNMNVTLSFYHWTFLAQPVGFPERLLAGNEEFYIRSKLTSQGHGKGGFSEEEQRHYVRLCTPEHIHGVCEDYRAGAGVDLAMDNADRESGRKVECPVMLLWGATSHLSHQRDHPAAAWAPYASDVRIARALPCGHYPTEQAPEETYSAFLEFFGE